MRRFAVAALFFVALVAAWQGMVLSGRWSPVLLPSPEAVGEYLWTSLRDGTLIEAIGVTLRRLLIGYTIGIVLGLPLGLLSSRFAFFQDTIGVLALGLQTLPSVCWVPLALLWFGQSEGAMLFVVVMGTAWSVAIATDTGARTIPRVYARAARTMGSEGLHQWTRVILPASLPYLISGMKQGWAFAWRSLMAAENLRDGPDGLWFGAAAPLRTRAECDGTGHRNHDCHRCDRVVGGQGAVCALGAVFAPSLGH